MEKKKVAAIVLGILAVMLGGAIVYSVVIGQTVPDTLNELLQQVLSWLTSTE